MFRLPEYSHDFSLRLSKVLDDIGVNEKMVMKRRRSALLQETVLFITDRPVYLFGSQSEGTTIRGLNSDLDALVILPDYIMIHDYFEWKQGRTNLLMIQDEETAPGYCKLQMIRPDVPLPVTDVLNQHCFRDDYNRILIKNSFLKQTFSGTTDGPADSHLGQSGVMALDHVPAFSCTSWPYEARDWLNRMSGLWPTAEMKRYAGSSGYMAVAAGSKISQIQHLEWRISTCKAERCLMFNLNITQLRCYVLMKMILKTYRLESVTSYMCKTVLLHCIESSHPKEWQESNVLACLLFCVHRLYLSVLHRSCPHFIIRKNNLMAGKICSADVNKLKPVMRVIMQNLGLALLRIQIDDLGQRLQQSIYPQNVNNDFITSAGLVKNFVAHLCGWPGFLKECSRGQNYRTVFQHVTQTLLKTLRHYREGNYLQQKAMSFLVPILCSLLGSVLASLNIGTNNSVSPEAVSWLSMGLNSDVSSGRLKQASAFYCAGDMPRTESILKETERLYCLGRVQPICCCNHFTKHSKHGFCRVCYNQNENAIPLVCAFCIRFIPAEINCIPRELQYEMFRSPEDDLQYRDVRDGWMDLAVVDSLPFLYFLQYKTYGCLHRYNEQQRALTNLLKAIFTEINLGHKETALNLLGQCFEQENSPSDALTCYKMSLNIRERNNAAKYHLSRIIGNMLNCL